MKKYAVIVAGGSGLRMGTELPKQFLLLGDRSVLYYSIMAFLKTYEDVQIILVLPEEHIGRALQIVQQTNAANQIEITAGGTTRFESVKYGLELVEPSSIVFVHDGVRCLVTEELIIRCYEQAVEKGSAIPAVTASDTIRLIEGDSHHLVDRNKVRIVQTPQTFNSDILLAAFEQPYQENFTDEATVVENMGTAVYLIEGDYNNLKLTRPIDLVIAEKILEERSALQ